MADQGQNISWRTRFRRVARALQGECYSEADADERWAEARQRLSGSRAYALLVDSYAAAAEAAKEAACDGAVGPDADAPAGPGKLAWLPRWCYLDVGADERTGPGDAAGTEATAMTTLWFGDIPRDIASEKRVAEVLHTLRPASIAAPFVKKVVSQGYRANPVEDGTCEGSGKRAPNPWLGYAFVVFRDQEEAAEALKAFDGATAGGWALRVHWAEAKHQGGSKHGRRLAARLGAGRDPALAEQLFPSCLHGEALAAAVERHRAAAGVAVAPGSEAWMVAELVKAAYRRRPRREIAVAGSPLPVALVEPLLRELQRTRWPPSHHRSGMQAQEYLVLYPGKRNDGFEELLPPLLELLGWADPAYGCNRIAVTRDFQGSPHIDECDTTYQYAASLGDFDTGGQLCVEGESADEVYVVDTHNRVARVDGRFVHWVRGHSGGERFSVIFFCSSPSCATERGQPFHAGFLPHGAA